MTFRFIRFTGVLLLLGLAGCQAPATQLNFQARDEGRRLVVKGATSLPDQAPLLIWLQKTPLDRPLIQGMAVVQSHHFEAVLLVPVTLAQGPYFVRVYFSPQVRTWTPQLQEQVGVHGEKLHGPLVHVGRSGDRVLELYEPTWIGKPSV